MQSNAPVTAPPVRPPLYGLLAAAAEANLITEQDLASGWAYQPETCGQGGTDAPVCAGNVSAMTPPEDPPTSIEGEPIWIWAADECSTFGFAARDWNGRAERQLAATVSYRLAAETWDGTVAQASSLPNRYFAGNVAWSDTVTSAASAVGTALANIEQGLAELLFGAQGMIHCTPQALSHLVDRAGLLRQGNLWVSPMGHIVVADAGYSGDGPGGATASTSQWMYGTSMLRVALGGIETIPGNLDDARVLAQALDRELNDIVVYSGRLAGVQWANHCGFVAAELDLPVALIGGAS